MNGDRIVQAILGLNILIVAAAELAVFNVKLLPPIRSEDALQYASLFLFVMGALLWYFICIADRNAAKRLKGWADLFWNAWSYYGVYSLAHVVVTGQGDIKEVLPKLSPDLLTPIIFGVLFNAMIRIMLASNDILDIRDLRVFAVLRTAHGATWVVGCRLWHCLLHKASPAVRPLDSALNGCACQQPRLGFDR